MNSGPGSTRARALGAIVMFLGVALGAFATHALRAVLSPASLKTFETGVTYQLAHGLAILCLSSLPRAERVITLFAVGIAAFSGSLYLFALTGQKWLVGITPLGGVCFLSGWALLAWQSIRPPEPVQDLP